MNPILKLAQQIKDAEGVTLAAVIEKVEKIRVSEEMSRKDIEKLAQALVTLKKTVDGIPLDSEVKRLQRAISDATERVSDSLGKEISSLRTELKATEVRLLEEMVSRIPDIVTVTEKVTEVAKELNEEEQKKVLEKVLDPEFVAKVRDVIESFEDDERLDASKLKNLPEMQTLQYGGGGSNLTVYKDGVQVNSSTRLNFVGSGVAVTTEAGGTKVTINGGGGGYTNLTEFVDQTAWRVFYSNGSGDVNELALGADGTFLKSNGASSAPSFAVPAGSGDVSKVGTPVNNQVGVWTGDGTIEGDTALTFDTTDDTLTVGGKVVTPIVRASSSAGLILQSNSGTQVADFGAGGGSNATFAGGVNIDGTTRLATSLTGPLRADSGVVSVGTDNAGITRTIVVTSGSATMGAAALTDYVYLVAGAHTMTLPTAVGNTNRYTVKNNHSAAITVDTTSSQTIDGTTTISINPQSSVDIISNNSNWFII